VCEYVCVCAGGCRTSITGWPSIGGRQLDLYTLYTSVIKLGGWEKVRCNSPLFDSTIVMKHLYGCLVFETNSLFKQELLLEQETSLVIDLCVKYTGTYIKLCVFHYILS